MPKIALEWIPLLLLESSNLDKLSDDISGVYRLSYKHQDGNIYVFYVGSSRDIKAQLKKHLDESENDCIKLYVKSFQCYFRYAKFDQADLTPKVVGELYKFYQPHCNEPIEANGSDIQINVT